MSENIKYTISAVDNFSGVFGRIDKSIKNAEDKLAKFGQAGKVITAGSVALAAGLGATVKVAADFEASMSRVGALSGATDAEMAQLTQTAKDLGANTVFSASEAASGMQYLSMA